MTAILMTRCCSEIELVENLRYRLAGKDESRLGLLSLLLRRGFIFFLSACLRWPFLEAAGSVSGLLLCAGKPVSCPTVPRNLSKADDME